jgi:hypothetical protein
MRKPLLVSFLIAAALCVQSCAGPGGRNYSAGTAIGQGMTLIVGRIVIEPEPEKGEKKYFGEDMDGQVRIFCDNVLRSEKAHENSFWDAWPVKIEGYEGQTFYYPVRNSRIYGVMAGYLMGRGNSYEMIHLPVLFTIDINPGDKAVYIGTIRFKRDLFYNVKKIDVFDEYAKVLPEFLKNYGSGVKLKKAVATVINQ